MCTILEMQVFDDTRSVTLSWHLTLADAHRYVGRTAHGMANAAALARQQSAYLSCRSAGIFTEISSFWCHNPITSKIIVFPKFSFQHFYLSDRLYMNQLDMFFENMPVVHFRQMARNRDLSCSIIMLLLLFMKTVVLPKELGIACRARVGTQHSYPSHTKMRCCLAIPSLCIRQELSLVSKPYHRASTTPR